MDQIDLIQRMNATLALSLAFQRLDPYQLDQLNETLYTELERFFLDHCPNKPMKISAAQYQHVFLQGMKKYHMRQLYTQKVTYDHFCESERIRATLPVELREDEIAKHQIGYKHLFDEFEKHGQKKDPATESGQGLKVSAERKRA